MVLNDPRQSTVPFALRIQNLSNRMQPGETLAPDVIAFQYKPNRMAITGASAAQHSVTNVNAPVVFGKLPIIMDMPKASRNRYYRPFTSEQNTQQVDAFDMMLPRTQPSYRQIATPGGSLAETTIGQQPTLVRPDDQGLNPQIYQRFHNSLFDVTSRNPFARPF